MAARAAARKPLCEVGVRRGHARGVAEGRARHVHCFKRIKAGAAMNTRRSSWGGALELLATVTDAEYQGRVAGVHSLCELRRCVIIGMRGI